MGFHSLVHLTVDFGPRTEDNPILEPPQVTALPVNRETNRSACPGAETNSLQYRFWTGSQRDSVWKWPPAAPSRTRIAF
jgi:hypothetical protein